MRCTRFLGLHGGLIFKITQDRRGTPEPETRGPGEIANRTTFSHANRVCHFQRERCRRNIRGASRERNDGSEQKEGLHNASKRITFRKNAPDNTSASLCYIIADCIKNKKFTSNSCDPMERYIIRSSTAVSQQSYRLGLICQFPRFLRLLRQYTLSSSQPPCEHHQPTKNPS